MNDDQGGRPFDSIPDILSSLEGLIQWKRNDTHGGHDIKAVWAVNPAAAAGVAGYMETHPDAPILVVEIPSFPERPTKRALLSEATAEQLNIRPMRDTYNRDLKTCEAIRQRGIEVLVFLHTERLVSASGSVRRGELKWLISILKDRLPTTRLMLIGATQNAENALAGDDGWVTRHLVTTAAFSSLLSPAELAKLTMSA